MVLPLRVGERLKESFEPFWSEDGYQLPAANLSRFERALLNAFGDNPNRYGQTARCIVLGDS
jgi:hypothetical protein